MPVRTDLGEKIVDLRDRQLMNQRELAEKAGLSERALVLIENNRVKPHVATLRKLVAALGIDASEFFE